VVSGRSGDWKPGDKTRAPRAHSCQEEATVGKADANYFKTVWEIASHYFPLRKRFTRMGRPAIAGVAWMAVPS
jgi:hypothetical protein